MSIFIIFLPPKNLTIFFSYVFLSFFSKFDLTFYSKNNLNVYHHLIYKNKYDIQYIDVSVLSIY